MSTSTIHAPCANFILATTKSTTAVVERTQRVHYRLQLPAAHSILPPVPHHPGLGESERDEHSHRVERDEQGG